jgi:predicted AlkP superfamily phosphohydrolase/phosphomutase
MTIFLLGLDGASMNTIKETLDRTHLSNFEKLIEKGNHADLKSVYPYVTAPAWTTIFSGVNPGKHGIFEMFEVRDEKIVPSNMRATDVPLLWDYLTWANKRSLVIGIPFIHPAPRINGIFVTGRFAPRLSCYPEQTGSRFDLQGFNYDDLSMEEKTEKILVEGSEHISTRILENLEKRTKTIGELIDSEKWDVAIVVEGLPDDLLHLSYGNNAIVDEMYLALDRLLGEILKRMTANDSLIIFSDHGFCKVENVLFMNEWLLQKKYTTSDETLLSRFLMRMGFNWESLSNEGFTSRVFRFGVEHFPWMAERIKNSVRSGMLVDESRLIKTSAVSAFSINEPLAWLRISEDREGSPTQERLISELQELKEKGVLKNIFESEKIYSGKFLQFAPGKILVEAPKGWTVDTLRWNRRNLTGRPLFSKKGVHQREGIMLVYGSEFELESPRIHDIVPTVLGMLKLPIPENIDGKSLLIKSIEKEPEKLLNVAQRL